MHVVLGLAGSSELTVQSFFQNQGTQKQRLHHCTFQLYDSSEPTLAKLDKMVPISFFHQFS
jgi:hypothetical protein